MYEIMDLGRLRDEVQVAWDRIAQECINQFPSITRSVEECVSLRVASTHY